MKKSHGTLFIIDDDPKSRKAAAALASSINIRCETFDSAEAFLDRCDPSLTGCALVDFHLGGMDGLQLQDRLQTMGSALSVILISAHADVSLAVRAIKNGAVAVIEKPYKDNELADAIREALDQSTGMQQSIAQQADARRRQQFIAHDLHDGVVRYLAMAIICLEDYERFHVAQTEEAAVLRNAMGLLTRSIDELRSLIRGVEVATSAASIADALKELLSDFQNRLEIELVHDSQPAILETWLTHAIYRIVQESLTNASRHSQTRRVRIAVTQGGGQLGVDVKDWGIGFDPKNVERGRLGLKGIHQRARLLGGKAMITSTVGEGTCVSVRIPLAPQAAKKSTVSLSGSSASVSLSTRGASHGKLHGQ